MTPRLFNHAAMLKLFVGVTDKNWFDFLSTAAPDEVNFWQPSGSSNFRALQKGELFLFKLHSPNNFIVGGGVFSHASNVPLSMAWEAFGLKNGVSSREEMRRRIASYRKDQAILDPRADPIIGCRILTQPFFWPREQWLPMPESFALNTVVGKGYSTDTLDGQHIWDAVVERSAGLVVEAERYGKPSLIRPRLGQGAFRMAVTDAYERRCAVSGEKTLPILDAAHIKSFSAGGEHDPSNGLLLRTDIHRLFDLGYVTVTDGGTFEVSHRLKTDFDNGKHYYDLHGTKVRPPIGGLPPPAPEALRWHNENRYLG